jgi:glycosyltransferase involved in cell wall biosynthesis
VKIQAWNTTGGACQYYRVDLPLGELARHGHEVTIPPGQRLVPDVEDVYGADVMVGQRVASEPAYAQWRHHRAILRARGGALVWEVDDDIWAIDLENPPLASYLHPQVGDWAARFVAESDLVTVSTAPLAERVSRWNRNVVVLPNRINAALLDLPKVERTSGKVRVGWTCSTSHVTDLRSVLAPWREFFRSRPDVELHIIGHDYRPMLELPGVRHTGWRSDLMDYYAGIDFDIGLAPLADLPFNRAKSELKCVEYAARGIPVVASDSEPYREFVRDGVTGFLVRSPEEWGQRIGELADDEAMRAEMGAAARKVAERWTVQEHWGEWERAYQSVLA